MKAILLLLTATGTLATLRQPLQLKRDIVEIPCSESGLKDCGSGCIQLTYTCCPDGSGGCPVGAKCDLADNGEYGCCPLGETCIGPGGATTRPGETITTTIVSTIDQTISQPVTYTVSSSSSSSSSSTEQPPEKSSTTEVPLPSTTPSPTPVPLPSPTDVSNGTATTASTPAMTAAAAEYGYSTVGVLGAVLAGIAAWVM